MEEEARARTRSLKLEEEVDGAASGVPLLCTIMAAGEMEVARAAATEEVESLAMVLAPSTLISTLEALLDLPRPVPGPLQVVAAEPLPFCFGSALRRRPCTAATGGAAGEAAEPLLSWLTFCKYRFLAAATLTLGTDTSVVVEEVLFPLLPFSPRLRCDNPLAAARRMSSW